MSRPVRFNIHAKEANINDNVAITEMPVIRSTSGTTTGICKVYSVRCRLMPCKSGLTLTVTLKTDSSEKNDEHTNAIIQLMYSNF